MNIVIDGAVWEVWGRCFVVSIRISDVYVTPKPRIYINLVWGKIANIGDCLPHKGWEC